MTACPATSLPCGQLDGSAALSAMTNEPMPLSDILEGTSFVSMKGRVYRLFGNEDESFSLPEIPPIPASLVASSPTIATLEESLQQIDAFSLLETSPHHKFVPLTDSGEEQSHDTDKKNDEAGTPMAQLLQAMGEETIPVSVRELNFLSSPQQKHLNLSCSHKKFEEKQRQRCSETKCPDTDTLLPPRITLSVESITGESGAQFSIPKDNNHLNGCDLLRVVSDTIPEPFIVPFVVPSENTDNMCGEGKTAPIQEESASTSPALKIVDVVRPKINLFQSFQNCWFRRYNKKNVLIHSLPTGRCYFRPAEKHQEITVSSGDEKEAVNTGESGKEKSGNTESVAPDAPAPLAFHWSSLIDSLMQTADNQIQTLADHLIVQANQGNRGICFKSVFPGDGCSTIVLCAARALTDRGYRVLLVDSHHRHLDLPNQLNVPDCFEPENSDCCGKVLLLSEKLDLWVWKESHSAEENRKNLRDILILADEKQTTPKYDIVLVDDGSITECPLTEFIEFWDPTQLDGVILVSSTKQPTVLSISHIAERLRQHHIPLIGVSENHV